MLRIPVRSADDGAKRRTWGVSPCGRKKWKRESGYHRRSIAETTQKLRFSPPWRARRIRAALDSNAFLAVVYLLVNSIIKLWNCFCSVLLLIE